MRTLILAALWSAALAGQTAVNFRFEPGILGQAPAGWHMSTSHGSGYRAALVDRNCYRAAPCLMLAGPAWAASGSFADIYETAAVRATAAGLSVSPVAGYGLFPAIPRAARHLRFRAAARVEGLNTRARLWLRADGVGNGACYRYSPEVTIAGWAYYQVDLEIAPGTRKVAFGFQLSGPGKAWVDDASLEEVAPKSRQLQSPPPRVTRAAVGQDAVMEPASRKHENV